MKNKTMGPLSIYFMPHKDDDGFDIFSNGEKYPTIKETEKALESLTLFLEEMKKMGQKGLDKINEKIHKKREEEMHRINQETREEIRRKMI